MKRFFNILLLSVLSLMLFSCKNAFNMNLEGGENSIIFTLPQTSSAQNNSRAVYLGTQDYFAVKCTNTRSSKVVFENKFKPGDVVEIPNLSLGNYSVLVELYQKDIYSGFADNFVKTAEKSQDCTIKGGEEELSIVLPVPSFYGLTSFCEPIYVYNNLILRLCEIDKDGAVFGMTFASSTAVEKIKSFSINSKEVDLSQYEWENFTNKDMTTYFVYFATYTNDEINDCYQNAKPVTLKVELTDSEAFTMVVSGDFFKYVSGLGEMKEYNFGSNRCRVNNYFFEGEISLPKYNFNFYVTKQSPYRVYYRVQTYDEQLDENSYYFDSFKFEGSEKQYSQKLWLMNREGKYADFMIGETFQTFEELSAALTPALSDGKTKCNFSSSTSDKTYELQMPSTLVRILSGWLKSEEYKPETETCKVTIYTNHPNLDKSVTVEVIKGESVHAEDLLSSNVIQLFNEKGLIFNASNFIGFATSKSGKVVYASNSWFEVTSDMSLYAIWNGIYGNADVDLDSSNLFPKNCPAGFTIINDKNDFIKYLHKANVTGNYFLNTDIEITGTEWQDVDVSFEGIFNGNGHTITFLSNYEVKPLFTNINNGIVMALQLKGKMQFSSDVTICAPFGTVKEALIIACDLSGLSLTDGSADPQYYHFGKINDSSTVIASFYKGEVYENEAGYDEDDGCFKNCYNTYIDDEISAANGAIVTQNIDDPEYSCNYHFAKQGEKDIVILSGAPAK